MCTFPSFVLQALERLAELVAIQVGELEAMLTVRKVKQGLEVFSKQLDVQDAARTRDAIVKALYEVGTEGYSLQMKEVWGGGGLGAVIVVTQQ